MLKILDYDVRAATPGRGARPRRLRLRTGAGSAVAAIACGGAAWLSAALACTPSQPPPRTAIQSANPDERIRGIHEAAERNDRYAVPLLVDRLEDEDEAVRFYAILALEKMTGHRLGYDYAQSAVDRVRAVERWREYVRQGLHVAAPDRTGADGDAGARPVETAVGDHGRR